MRHLSLAVVILTAAACSGGGDPVTAPTCPPTCTIPKAISVSFAGGAVASEIAATITARNNGLMNRSSIAADSGMIFIWATDRNPQTEGFWMLNTHFDLSVAFLDAQKRVINIEDMTAETVTVHLAAAPFRYAIEARKGWFASHGVVAGATATFTIPTGLIIDP